MASSGYGSQVTTPPPGVPPQGERVGLKIPFFRWGHRRYYFFIGFRVRRNHYSFRWPSADELQRLALEQQSQVTRQQLAAGETQPLMIQPLMMKSAPASPDGSGSSDSSGGSTGTDATYSLECGVGSDTSYGMMPPPDPDPEPHKDPPDR